MPICVRFLPLLTVLPVLIVTSCGASFPPKPLFDTSPMRFADEVEARKNDEDVKK